MSSSNIGTILFNCNKTNLLRGCRAVGSSTFIFVAMGDRNDVLHNCGTTTSCKRVANGASWYYSNMYSWGFADRTDSVNRNPCDLGTINAADRLCWLTNNGGGHRCGSITGLTSSTAMRKLSIMLIKALIFKFN